MEWFLSPLASVAIVLGTSLFIFLYRRATNNFDVFRKQGINGPKPVPVVGNLWGIWNENIPEYDMKMLKKYGKTYGYFDGTTANLYTVDEQLIRSVLLKDFDHFVNRRDFGIKDKVFRMFLSLMKDQEWKDVRSSVSPTFTTGKIKRMSPLIRDRADNLVSKLEEAVAKHDGVFRVKKYFSCYTMDVIARCAFGMKIDNLGEKNDPFTENAAFLFNPPINHSPVILLPLAFPTLGEYLAKYIFMNKQFRFFIDTADSMVTDREKSTQKFHDFVEIATEAIMESKRDGDNTPMWTKEEVKEIVVAQCVLFLLAGFDTTGTTLTIACFLLAQHPEVQERLYKDIQERLEHHKEITHELINEIPYLDQVINETLRLYPPAVRLERKCNKDISYGHIHIKKDMVVSVSTFALHRLEEYYENPLKFDPERWTPENKAKRSPYVFMPFGAGPRNCIGMRFALEEIKMALCTVINKFKILPSEETPESIQIVDGFIGVIQLKDFPLRVELRQEGLE